MKTANTQRERLYIFYLKYLNMNGEKEEKCAKNKHHF